MILSQLLILLFFLAISIFVFYIPGSLFLRKSKNKFRDDEKIVLGLGIGFILFLLLGFLGAFLQIRWIVLPLLLLVNLFAVTKYKLGNFSPFLGLLKQKLLLAFLLLGTLVEGFINFPSGLLYSAGNLYWSSQGHDGLWHIAIIEQMKSHFPPTNPLYAGESLYNYHYLADFIIAEFNRIFSFFSSSDLFFRDFSFLISFLMGLAAYSFLTTWRQNKNIGLFGIFFTYFVGSFGYIVLLIQHRGFFGGETIFWAAQGNTIIGNMPHAFNYFLIPTFFLALYYFLKDKGNLFLSICFLLGGFLVGFKVSAGVVLLAGLGAACLAALLFKQNKKILVLTAAIGISNFLTFKLITKEGESLLMFLPWWFIRTMIVVPDRVNWMDLELRREFYLARGGIRATLRIFEYESIAFLIFLIGNLGTRFVGFAEIIKDFWKNKVYKDTLEIALLFTMFTGFVIPIFFVQKGVTYNLIQFMQYFLLIFGFFSAISLYNFLNLFKNKPIKIIIFFVFFALSVPTVIGNLKDFYGKNPLAIISNQEIEALNFLKNKSTSQDVILTEPFNPYSKGLFKNQPWPIYAWDSTGYVSAYTGRQTYYTDEGQMQILGIKGTEERLKAMKDFFELSTPIDKKAEFLKTAKINFIYLREEEANQIPDDTFSKLGLSQIFKNDEAVIYQKEK